SALGELTATVAHEFRNPLSAISNTVYTLKEVAAAHGLALERLFARLDRNIMRCEHLIADLLDFTQPRQLRQQPTRLDPWVGDVLDKYGAPDGIEVVRRLAAPETLVALDRDRFQRVLSNMLDNAVEAIRSAACTERRITVSTVAVPSVAIVIEDTGPGIDAETMTKIFEPLFSTKSFGTGLGLPAAKQIIEQHGGTVSVASDVGAGTRVRIALAPLSADRAVA
ncbi:MAG TPA: ATP-binding protein, partial [Stellaceae bacterium]|nr:ATP-binding protein [Stellaceae bacterium]